MMEGLAMLQPSSTSMDEALAMLSANGPDLSRADQSRASGVRGVVRDGPSHRSNAVTVARSMRRLTQRGANTDAEH